MYIDDTDVNLIPEQSPKSPVKISLDDLIRREEAKWDAHWDPALKWQAIQETIAWADAQAQVPRNTRQRCLELQREKLAKQNAKQNDR